jgi:predicted ATPase
MPGMGAHDTPDVSDPANPSRIVLTGGPGAGKTAVARALAERWSDRYVLVPEAATQVYERLQTRWDRLDLPGRCQVQRRIYHLQVQQERELAEKHPGKILLLDRGTVDGSAYWPQGPEDYWLDLGTTLEAELRRYDRVIWLETCAVLEGAYDGHESNPCRFEDRASAIASGQLLLRLWSRHPHLARVPAQRTLERKVDEVARLLGHPPAAMRAASS